MENCIVSVCVRSSCFHVYCRFDLFFSCNVIYRLSVSKQTHIRKKKNYIIFTIIQHEMNWLFLLLSMPNSFLFFLRKCVHLYHFNIVITSCSSSKIRSLFPFLFFCSFHLLLCVAYYCKFCLSKKIWFSNLLEIKRKSIIPASGIEYTHKGKGVKTAVD